MEMYVEGVSTRKVKDITEALCGTSFSKSLVSSLAESLDVELRAWRERRLEGTAYPYLFVDARYEKVRVGHRIVSQRVLIVSAVRDDGFREIVGVEVANTESEATYQDLFRSLKSRGLKGVELVVSDHHESLKAAVFHHYQRASWQRCQVHYARNLLGMVGAKSRKELAADLRAVFAATSSEQALGIASKSLGGGEREAREGRRAHRSAHRGAPLMPGLPREPPKAHPHYNGQERLNQEIKRRTRVVRIFPNRESCLRLVSALAVEQSEEWVTGRRYLDMRELEEQRREERQAMGRYSWSASGDRAWRKLQKFDLSRASSWKG